jgi:DNA modification methylase
MTKTQWLLVHRRLSQLDPHPSNPRKLTKEQHAHLTASLDKFGVAEKPIINKNNQIIGGHQRIKVMQELGMTEIDCWMPTRLLSKEECDELNIRLNKNVGEWDWDILANEWEVDDLKEWGFDDKDLLGIVMRKDCEEDESQSLEPCKDEDAITKLGDLYELGQHRLICGDSTVSDVVDKVLDGNKPILMVTDPPYGVEYDASWREVTGKRRRAKGKVQNDSKINWEQAWNLFHGDICYVWCASWYLSETDLSLQESDFEKKSLIIWAKQHFALSRGDYHWQHEPCWYCVRKGKNHNWQGSRKEATLWHIDNLDCFGKSQDEDMRTSHSTQKPLECMARPIRNSSAAGEGVYDPFLGSGTTLIAAEKLGRI